MVWVLMELRVEWKGGYSANKKPNEVITVVIYSGGHTGYTIRESTFDQVTEKAH